jgi:hypothetical protein
MSNYLNSLPPPPESYRNLTQLQMLPPQSNYALFYVGAVRYARQGWEKFFADPQAPERYGAEAARKFVEEKRAKQEEQSHVTPFSCYLASVCVLDQDGQTVLAAACEPGDTYAAALALTQFASQQPAGTIRWYGFDIRDILLSAALETMRHNNLVVAANDGMTPTFVEPGFWYNRPFAAAPCVDPYEALVPSQLRSEVDIRALCDFLGLPAPSMMLAEHHVERAHLAFTLARVANLDSRVFA